MTRKIQKSFAREKLKNAYVSRKTTNFGPPTLTVATATPKTTQKTQVQPKINPKPLRWLTRTRIVKRPFDSFMKNFKILFNFLKMSMIVIRSMAKNPIVVSLIDLRLLFGKLKSIQQKVRPAAHFTDLWKLIRHRPGWESKQSSTIFKQTDVILNNKQYHHLQAQFIKMCSTQQE